MSEIKKHYSEIFSRVNKIRTSYYLEKILFGIFLSLLIVFGFMFIGLSLEAIIHASSIIRTIFVLVFSIILISTIFRFVVKPILQLKNILQSLSVEDVSMLIGNKFPTIKDNLRNALQISKIENGNEFVLATLESVKLLLDEIKIENTISFLRIKRFAKTALACGVILFTIFIFPETGFSDAFGRIINFSKEYKTPAFFDFKIYPGNTQIIKDEDIELRANVIAKNKNDLQINLIDEIELSVLQEGIKTATKIFLKKNSFGEFVYKIKNAKQTFNYTFSFKNIKSDDYKILILERPIVRSLKVKIIPPSYTNLPSEILEENIGDVTALVGSKINWSVQLENNIKNAKIKFISGRELKLQLIKNIFSGEIILNQNDKYEIILEDEFGNTNTNPIQYQISTIADENPKIEILLPAKNIDIATDLQLLLLSAISDDFGFSSMRLAHRLIHSKYEKPQIDFHFQNIPITKLKPNEEIEFNWDLKKLSLVPEDVVEYYIEIFDNDNISGPKFAKSQTYLVRLPSFEEVVDDLEKGHDETFKSLKETLKDATEIKKEVEELSREMKKNKITDWQQTKKIENLVNKLLESQKKVEDIKNNISEMTDAMQKNSMLSPETMEKYFELQKLMKDLNNPEFLKALERLQQGIKQLSTEEIKKAMEQIQFSEEMFRASIERTLNLLKKIQIEQKVNELVERAENLLKHQNELIEETKSSSNSNLSEKQNEIKKEFNQLQNELSKMEEFAKENNSDFPSEKFDDAKKTANKGEIEQNINESIEDLKNKNLQKALNAQKSASKNMQKLSSQLQSMQQQLLENQLTETMTALQKSIGDLLKLSQEQESLKNKSLANKNENQNLRAEAQEQLSLQSDLNSIANNLTELSQKSFAVTPAIGKAIGKAMQNMMQSIKGLEDRNSTLAIQSQNASMSALNEAASIISQTMNSLSQQQGGGGSLLEQMRNMSGKQQSLNMKTEELMRGKNGMSQEDLQNFGRLAREQNEIRKSLEDLNREAQMSPEKNRLLGELDDVVEKMKEVVRALESGDQNASEMQKKILSRMLDHQRSMQEKDFEEKRKSISGATPSRKTPKDLKLENFEKKKIFDLLKSEKEGFSKEYQVLIRKYFDELQKIKF